MASWEEFRSWLRLRSAVGRIVLFSGLVVVVWSVLAFPVYALGGRWSLLSSAAAALLCLVPGVMVLGAAGRLRKPQGLLVLTLGSSLLRLLVVVGGGAALYYGEEAFSVQNLGVWLVFYYFLCLAVETVLILGLATP